MNIEQRIEAAWNKANLAGECDLKSFEAGCRAMLATLCPEVRAEDLESDKDYWAYWIEAGRYVTVQTSVAHPVICVSLGDLVIPFEDIREFRGPILTPEECGVQG